MYVGFDLTIASFDSISEVSMVRLTGYSRDGPDVEWAGNRISYSDAIPDIGTLDLISDLILIRIFCQICGQLRYIRPWCLNRYPARTQKSIFAGYYLGYFVNYTSRYGTSGIGAVPDIRSGY